MWVPSASPALSPAASVLPARRSPIRSASLKAQLESPSAFDPSPERSVVLYRRWEILAPGGQAAQVQPADLRTPYFLSFTGCAFIHALCVRVIPEVHSSRKDESFMLFCQGKEPYLAIELYVRVLIAHI